MTTVLCDLEPGLRRAAQCASNRLGAKQGDRGYGGSQLDGAEDCQRWAGAQPERLTEEEAANPEPGKEHENVEAHGLPSTLPSAEAVTMPASKGCVMS